MLVYNDFNLSIILLFTVPIQYINYAKMFIHNKEANFFNTTLKHKFAFLLCDSNILIMLRYLSYIYKSLSVPLSVRLGLLHESLNTKYKFC